MLLGQWQSRHPNAVARTSLRISESPVSRPAPVQLRAIILLSAGSNKNVPKSLARDLGSVMTLGPSNHVGPAYDCSSRKDPVVIHVPRAIHRPDHRL
jgi:hypothetical protein